jgi:hypothetical protein
MKIPLSSLEDAKGKGKREYRLKNTLRSLETFRGLEKQP